MSNKQIEARKLAVSALKGSQEYKRGHTTFVEAVEELEEALAEQPEPLPVKTYSGGKAWHVAPTQPLTDEQPKQWAVFCGLCFKEWSVPYQHPGKSVCENCEAVHDISAKGQE